jgi:hypothetical protein
LIAWAEVGQSAAVDCEFRPLFGAIPTPQSIERLFQSSPAGPTFSRKRSRSYKATFPGHEPVSWRRFCITY